MSRNIIPPDIATKPFVKEAIEDAKLDLRDEMKKNHEETMEKLDSIMGESKNLMKNTLFYHIGFPNTQTN